MSSHSRLSRRNLLAGAAGTLALATSGRAVAQTTKPNIIFILADGLVTSCTSPYVIDNQSFPVGDLVILHDHSASRGGLPAGRDRFLGSRRALHHKFALPVGCQS
jgi:hypothetical protein